MINDAVSRRSSSQNAPSTIGYLLLGNVRWLSTALLLVIASVTGIPFALLPGLGLPAAVAQSEPQPNSRSTANRLFQQGNQQFHHSQFQDALASYQQALGVYQSLDRSLRQQGETLYNMAVCFRILGRYPEAEDAANQALAIAQQIDYPALQGLSLGELGVVEYSRSNYPQALEYYQQALDLSRTTGNTALEGQMLDHMGVVYRRQGDYQQALDLHQQALPLVQTSPDRAVEARVINNIGIVYDALGDYRQALEWNERALELSQEAGSRYVEARVLSSLGVTYDNLGDYARALEIYQQALVIHQDIGNVAEAGRTLNNIGGVYSRLGDYDQALTVYQQALQLRSQLGDRQGEAVSLGSIGLIYWNVGQYDSALTYYHQALTLNQTIGNRPGESDVLSNIGGVYYSRGTYAEALQYEQQALAIRQEIGDRRGQGYSLNSLGGMYYTLGQYDQALTYYQQALDIRQEIGDRTGTGSTLNNMGLVYALQGELEAALDYYQSALAIRQQVGDRNGEAYTLNNMGVIYHQLSQYDQALSVLESALTIRQEIGDRAGEAATLNNIALVEESLNHFPEALETYQQAAEIFQEVGDRAGERLAFSNLGRLLTAQQQSALAILFYKRSVNLSEAIRQDLTGLSPELQASYTETVATTYRNLADLLLQDDRVLEAQQVLDLLKVQELDDYLRDVRGNEQTAQGLEYWQPEQKILDLYDQAIAQGHELAQLSQVPQAQRTPTQQQRLAELVANQQTLTLSFYDFLDRPEVLEAVDELSRSTRRQSIDPAQFTTLQDNLTALNAVLLYPLILPDRLELVLVTPNAPPIRRTVPVSREDLNRAILQFRAALTNRTTNSLPQAQHLYRWLIQPIEADLAQANVDTILYAPDGQLRYIPLAALHDGQQWLIQRFQINYITALSLSEFDTPPQTDLRVLAAAFTQGSVSFQIGTREFRFGGLPFAAIEVENIAAEVPNTTELFNHDFTRSELEPRLIDHNVIHLATHAEFVPGNPEDSFIVLGDGDRVTLRDITTWPLQNVDLVVLSACKTAVGGALGNGEEILGFGYQIQRTGARAAIASLWSVDDGGTQLLMNAFYAGLEQGLSKTEALQQAQISLITGDYDALGLTVAPERLTYLDRPYYWAPFILIGNGL